MRQKKKKKRKKEEKKEIFQVASVPELSDVSVDPGFVITGVE